MSHQLLNRIRKVIYLMSLLFCFQVQGSPLQPGKIYQGGENISVIELGLGFVIPENWSGGLNPANQMFVMENQSKDALIFAIAEEATEAQLTTYLHGPLSLTPTLHLNLQEALTKDNKIVSGQYSVLYNPELLALVKAKNIKENVAVAFILVSEQSKMPERESVLNDMMANLKTLETSSTAQTLASQQEPQQVPQQKTKQYSSQEQTWQSYLKGKHIVRFYTASGYTEEQHIWLCSDGRFARKFDSGGFGGGASGAFSGRYGGRWQAQGAGEHGRLYLQFNTGEVSQYQLRWDYSTSKLYVDGKRWLHDNNQLCN